MIAMTESTLLNYTTADFSTKADMEIQNLLARSYITIYIPPLWPMPTLARTKQVDN